MQRRDFISLLGGGAVWPVAARAQESRRIRRIGFLGGWWNRDRPVSQADSAALLKGLTNPDWIEGRNLQIDRFNGREGPKLKTARGEV
jgi:putative ABC transport system substrate-binding protein